MTPAGGCAAVGDKSVFASLEQRLAAAKTTGGHDLGWAMRLRSALARYQRANTDGAKDPLAAAKWREIDDALGVLDRMSAEARVPPGLRAAMDTDGLWSAFRRARALCRMELQDRRPHPRTPPPPPAVQNLCQALEMLRRRRRPGAVEDWSARLQDKIGVYIRSEADLHRGRIPANFVAAAIDSVLASLQPPLDVGRSHPATTRGLAAGWDVERRKPIFQARLQACRDVLMLRQIELDGGETAVPSRQPLEF